MRKTVIPGLSWLNKPLCRLVRTVPWQTEKGFITTELLKEEFNSLSELLYQADCVVFSKVAQPKKSNQTAKPYNIETEQLGGAKYIVYGVLINARAKKEKKKKEKKKGSVKIQALIVNNSLKVKTECSPGLFLGR